MVPERVLGHYVFYEPYIVQTVKEGYRCRKLDFWLIGIKVPY